MVTRDIDVTPSVLAGHDGVGSPVSTPEVGPFGRPGSLPVGLSNETRRVGVTGPKGLSGYGPWYVRPFLSGSRSATRPSLPLRVTARGTSGSRFQTRLTTPNLTQEVFLSVSGSGPLDTCPRIDLCQKRLQ